MERASGVMSVAAAAALRFNGRPSYITDRVPIKGGSPAPPCHHQTRSRKDDAMKIVVTSVYVEDPPPTEMGPVTVAVLDDTCGNLIQIARPSE
jgi:hypothetical protein